MVPDVAAAAEGLFKQLSLGLVGVETDFDGGVLDGVAVHSVTLLPGHICFPPRVPSACPCPETVGRGCMQLRAKKFLWWEA